MVLDQTVKNIIYYTDNRLSEPLYSTVQKRILESGLPVVSASLKPIEFGRNEVVWGQPNYPTMVEEILSCLRRSPGKYVFFCEHDVLYPPSHFDFTPPRDDVYYYNRHVWRWFYGSDKAVRYERMLPLSCLCCSRELALKHYSLRFDLIRANLAAFNSREPGLARTWGYEPGTKKKRRGGLTDDDFETWYSAEPVIDVRHKGTYSPPKVTLDSFKHAPVNWQETSIDQLTYWADTLRGLR